MRAAFAPAIELIDTRFEVVRRDAEIRMLRKIAEGESRERAESEFREIEAKIAVDRNSLVLTANGAADSPENEWLQTAFAERDLGIYARG